MAEEVLIEVDDRGVATVTLNRPEVNNAYDEAMLRGVHAAVDPAEEAAMKIETHLQIADGNDGVGRFGRGSRAVACANIALAKYWGKSDVALNLPAVPSLSLTLEGLETHTEVTLTDASIDEVVLDVDLPVVSLGRILYDNQRGGYRSTLTLAGDLPAEAGARLLSRVAELLDSPVRLVM